MKAYDRTFWKDHVQDGEEVIQQGTPQSATNWNNMEEGISANNAESAVILQQLMQHKRLLGDVEGEIGELTLFNSQEYPFNNSQETIALDRQRDTLNYRVYIELVSSEGSAGDIVVSDKQINGFKIKFTGSAAEVTVKYYVWGGMYQ